MADDTKETVQPPKPITRWVSLIVACSALALTATNLWVNEQKDSASLRTDRVISTDAFHAYKESEKHSRLQFILQLADIEFKRDPSLAEELYRIALQHSNTEEDNSRIMSKINACKEQAPTKHGLAINMTLYRELQELENKSAKAFEQRPNSLEKTQHLTQGNSASTWDNIKTQLSGLIAIEKLPKRTLYDTTLAEQQLLAIRLQLQLSFAQWGVLNNSIPIYQEAITQAKALSSKAVNADFIKHIQALPNKLPNTKESNV